MSIPMTDLNEMLASIDVAVRPDPFVFASVSADAPVVGSAAASVLENEGLTIVVTEEVAREHGLPTAPLFAWLTLTIHSSLEAVGLTAAFSKALAEDGISCNVLAGFHHDHLLVAYTDRERAVAALRGLRTGA